MKRVIREIDNVNHLIEYLKKNLEKGYNLETLKWALINQGYSKINIERAVKFVSEIEEAKKPKSINEPKKTAEEALQALNNIPKIQKRSFWKKIKDFFS